MPFGNLGGWSLVVLLIVILLLFGAPKLPAIAKSIGQSLKVLKKEVRDLSDDEKLDQAVADVEQQRELRREAKAAKQEAKLNKKKGV